ncbi:MAG TPA: DUF4291 domain-containing protein [Candidatus Limnocylindrales bacterium]|nr:DUF4291 domain-containing protein [Candidatus Limnocylindrales bacterium]
MREVRASYTDETITVYQAYSPEIAEPALAAGCFVPPFKWERMTWIKPSFLWMMYRSGWAGKPGQEHVLAVSLRREGFEWALAHSCLSHFVPELFPDRQMWARKLKESPVRIQWDPERSLRMQPLPYRSLQVGLAGIAVDLYVDDWIVGIADVTALAREIHNLVRKANEPADLEKAEHLLPKERPYPLPSDVAKVIGADK